MRVKKGERSAICEKFLHLPSTILHPGKVKEVLEGKLINIGIFSLFIYFLLYITLCPAQRVYMPVRTHEGVGERTKRERGMVPSPDRVGGWHGNASVLETHLLAPAFF
jgi:hypothetical protein